VLLGYTVPNSNYITAAPIVIAKHNLVFHLLVNLQHATAVVDNAASYQWQLSMNGNLSSITNNANHNHKNFINNKEQIHERI
jgi:hypothetical protein